MPIRFDTSYDASQPELRPPYQASWPIWVLQARRRRCSTLPVLEICALLVCLTAIIGLSRTEADLPSDEAPLLVAPADAMR